MLFIKTLRKFATPLTIFSSLIVLSTGLWMFFFSKGKLLEDIHGKIGVLFFLAVILHIIINQGSFFKILKTKASYTSLAIIAIIGGLWIFALKENESEGVSPGLIFKKLEQAKVADVCQVFQKDCTVVIDNLNKAGLNISDTAMTIEQLSEQSHKSPRETLKYFFQD